MNYYAICKCRLIIKCLRRLFSFLRQRPKTQLMPIIIGRYTLRKIRKQQMNMFSIETIFNNIILKQHSIYNSIDNNKIQILKPMKSHSLLFLILIISIFFITTTSVKNKPILQTCLCDISDSCDYQCCCDLQCTQLLKDKLQQQKKCDDDGFGIPWCQNFNQTDIHIRDLYSGLSTIYTIIRRLFCLQRINIVNVTLYYQTISDNTTIDTLIANLQLQQDTKTMLSPQINSLTSLTINKVLLRDPMNICTVVNSLPKGQAIPRQSAISKCRMKIGDITNNPILAIETLLAGSSYSGLKIYHVDQKTSQSPTLLASPPTQVCTSISCTNLLRLLKLYINQDGTINLNYSYAYIGTVTFSQSTVVTDITNVYIDVLYSYQYLNSDSTLPKSSSQGYTIGSKLVLLKYTGTTYYHVPNPINLAYRSSINICSTGSNIQNSFVQLQFGKNYEYGCTGSTSSIYDNLKTIFNYVGKYGLSSMSNSLSDYIAVTWDNIDSSSSIKLTFNYVKVGALQNWQYYILNVDVSTVVQTQSEKHTLYIEYTQVQNIPTFYIPQPPKVHAYLPDDFLYPFYVVG